MQIPHSWLENMVALNPEVVEHVHTHPDRFFELGTSGETVYRIIQSSQDLHVACVSSPFDAVLMDDKLVEKYIGNKDNDAWSYYVVWCWYWATGTPSLEDMSGRIG